jgi:pyruvate formate lyase activating enzyme
MVVDARLVAVRPDPGAPGPAGDDVLAAVDGAVHSWDLSTGVDGPGTRFVLFTAGCPLRCLYCQNPDTWTERRGVRTSVADVMARVRRYRTLFDVTGGGVTVSGGEPLLQQRFTSTLLRACKAEGISTALDTSGALGVRADDATLADVDLTLLDVKCADPARYRRLTGGDLDPTLRFARRLAVLGRPTWVRYVLVPGWTDDVDEVAPLADFLAGLGVVERVDVLAFHRLGAAKYAALGIEYPLAQTPGPTIESLEAVRDVFRGAGLAVT